jgi:hypothetical protein
MAEEGTRTQVDIEFARAVGEELARDILRLGLLARPYVTRDHYSYLILDELKKRVGLYTGQDWHFLTSEENTVYTQLIERIRLIIAWVGPAGVPMLEDRDDAFKLDTIVDIGNPRALQTLADLASDGFNTEERPQPRYSRGWIRSLKDQGAPIRLEMAGRAAASFLTKLVDTLRSIAGSKKGKAVSGTTFTVNSRSPGFVLESWPHYNFSPTAFGSFPTTPVTDYLSSGHYRFQGRKGKRLIQDPGVHFAGPSRSATTLSAF